jgi:NAD(P)H-flavin reductase
MRKRIKKYFDLIKRAQNKVYKINNIIFFYKIRYKDDFFFDKNF